MRTVGSGVLALCAAAVAGCGLIAGLKDLPLPPDGWNDEGGDEAGIDASDETPEDAPLESLEATSDASAADEGAGDASSCTCVAIPTGWTGPFALYDGNSAVPAPSCAGTYGAKSFEGNADLSAPPASCAPCTCGSQTGAQCGAHLTYFTNPCGSTAGGCGGEDFALNAGVCQGLGTGNGGCAGRYVASFQADALESTVGSCQPSTSMPNGGPATWGTTAVACGPASALPACGPGEVCAPPSAAPFSALCIQAAGAQSCPSGSTFAMPHVYYTGVDDTRTCSQCACGTPQNVCSPSGTVTFWTACNCTGAPTGGYSINDVSASGCLTLPSMSYCSTWQPTTLTLGSCPASGGVPSGGVTPSASTAVTFCCTP